MLDSRAVAVAKRKADGVINLPAHEIARHLFQNGLTSRKVHESTILRWLDTGRSPVRNLPLVRKHHLSDAAKAGRLSWAREHRHTDWQNVLFTDSHIFQIGKATARKRLQRVKARKTLTTINYGPKIHVYAGVSVHGLTDLQFVSGTTGYQYTSPRTGKTNKGVSGEEYQHVMAKLFIPEGRRHFSGRDYVLYQDGAPAHRAKSTKIRWSQYRGVAVLQAAAKSPDLNVIENLWNILDSKLDGRVFKSIKHLRAAAKKAWRAISLETCRALVASMAARVEKVIQNDGGHIERNIYT